MFFNYSPYIFSTIIMMAGLFIIFYSNNLGKKLVGLSIFQNSVLLFFIAISYVKDSNAPFLECTDYNICNTSFSNPLPQVLMLTAIVVGVAITALGLSILIRIKEAYGTIEEDEIEQSEKLNNKIK